jgi:hypothetical protein
VTTLATGMAGPGRHRVLWSGRDSRGAVVPAGVYFARLQAGGREISRRIVILD